MLQSSEKFFLALPFLARLANPVLLPFRILDDSAELLVEECLLELLIARATLYHGWRA